MNERKRDPLDTELASLPRSIEPSRDLWPGIRAELENDAAGESHARAAAQLAQPRRWLQLAAGVALIAGASLVTFVVMRNPVRPEPAQVVQQSVPAPVLNVQQASFGSEALGAQYQTARADLDRQFQQRLTTLPPAERVRLESNLADLRRITQDMSTTLAQHPSDPLLQELLLSAYQNELKLLANVNEITMATSTRVEL